MSGLISQKNQLKLITDMKDEIKTSFSLANRITIYHGDCLEFMKEIPDKSIQLVVTSPPYNIGKPYEKKISLDEYVNQS